ncbi:MAG TPA: hypothetical protein VK083_19410 [Nocardia sp.]|uniref:hypothetical protein n=1 Tax=Nocardia sp. TaxID=1821 RepID=UPI002B4B04DA|nr:hypothetical protein [Nocardia sp.]HLS78951.1 hypothetical protein [Nocardia sp.]
MIGTVGRTGPVAVAIAALAVALSVSGCSDVERALNRGGDTPCGEYVKQDADTKRVTITKFVKERDNLQNEPSGTAVDLTMMAVDVLCTGQRNVETPIKQADLAGMVVNK